MFVLLLSSALIKKRLTHRLGRQTSPRPRVHQPPPSSLPLSSTPQSSEQSWEYLPSSDLIFPLSTSPAHMSPQKGELISLADQKGGRSRVSWPFWSFPVPHECFPEGLGLRVIPCGNCSQSRNIFCELVLSSRTFSASGKDACIRRFQIRHRWMDVTCLSAELYMTGFVTDMSAETKVGSDTASCHGGYQSALILPQKQSAYYAAESTCPFVAR